MRANRAALAARAERNQRLRLMVISALAEAIRQKTTGEKPKGDKPVQGPDGFPVDMDDEVKEMLTTLGLTRDALGDFLKARMQEATAAKDDKPRRERPMGEDGFPADMPDDVKARLLALGYKPGQREQMLMVDGDTEPDKVKEIVELLKSSGATFNAHVIRVGDDGEPVDPDDLPADVPEVFRDVLREAARSQRGDPMDNATWSVLINEQGLDPGDEPSPVLVTLRATEGLANEVHATLTQLNAPDSAHRGQGLIDLRNAGEARRHGHQPDVDCIGCKLEGIFTRVLTEGEVLQRRPVEMTPDGRAALVPRAGTPEQPVH